MRIKFVWVVTFAAIISLFVFQSIILFDSYKEDTVYHSRNAFDLNEEEIIEAGLYQQVLHNFGFPFNFNTLDSIFSSELQNEKLSRHLLLYFRDSTGVIIEQTKDLLPRQLKKAYKTDSLLIVNGKKENLKDDKSIKINTVRNCGFIMEF